MKVYVHTKTCTQNVCSSLIPDSRKVEMTQMYFNRWDDLTTYGAAVPSCHGILLNDKKEQTVDRCNSLGYSPENYAEREKSQSQKVSYCIVPFI